MSVIQFPRVGRHRRLSERSEVEQRRFVIDSLIKNVELARAAGNKRAERQARAMLASIDWQDRDLDLVLR